MPKLNRIYILLLLLVGLSVLPVSAQDVTPEAASETARNAEYPTYAALEASVIPPLDRVDLAERLHGVRDIPPTPTSAPARQVGEQQTFTAANDDVTFTIQATLQVVGEHIYLWVEDGTTIRKADLQQLADDFDRQIYPSVRELWGSEDNPGVDGDPRIYGLFAHNLGASVAAYFASDNTYPREVRPASNEHEMFFFNLDVLNTNQPLPLGDIESTVAHEFQHMIRNNLQLNEETWLNEGLSVFTQAYLYGDLGSAPISFLDEPDTQLNSWNADPAGRAANYGAASMFLIYLYERYGIDMLTALSADPSTRGLDAVNNVLLAQGDPGVNDFFADWVLANTIWDADFANGKYSYPDLPVLALPQPKINTYPFTESGQVNQYAARYLAFTGLNDTQTLDLHLDAPDTVALIPALTTDGGHYWYSNRGDSADLRLTRAFDLTGVEHARLHYRLWYDNEETWDYGYVMVSTDGGANWDILSTDHTTSDDPHSTAYGAGYNGASDGWVKESVGLDAYAGRSILLRFELITDDAVNQPGMAVDDVRIPEIGYADDFETGGGDWQADGWLWTDNRLPQRAWVQVAQQRGTQTLALDRWLFDGTDVDQSIDLVDGATSAVVVISPFAPVTTVAMPYTITVDAG